jgi:glyoxylase-like metal-dependent hydrolase (beta-lactamase superfamily II)
LVTQSSAGDGIVPISSAAEDCEAGTRLSDTVERTPPSKDELKWVANATTLIHGERDALLVDTFLSAARTAKLADWIAASGKRLATIYITHAHPDHFFGLNSLRARLR